MIKILKKILKFQILSDLSITKRIYLYKILRFYLDKPKTMPTFVIYFLRTNL
jgi:hypothetical protein